MNPIHLLQPMSMLLTILFSFIGVKYDPVHLSDDKFRTIAGCSRRPSAIFILGEDKGHSNAYYSLAKEYYLPLENPYTYVASDCRSLESLMQFLRMRLPCNAEGWGRIILIVHGNPWTGLSIPVNDGRHRVSAESLVDAIQSGDLQSLPDSVVDEETVIEVKACALGYNSDLLHLLGIGIGGFDDERPHVVASTNFIYYILKVSGEVAQFEARPYFAFYKTGYRPPNFLLERQLKSRYPNSTVPWLEAINIEEPTLDRYVFSNRFNVPVHWEIPWEDRFLDKDWEKEESKLKFIKSQDDLMDVLNVHKIPIDKFRWNISIKIKGGQRHLEVKGKSTVLCILAVE